jgi:hypothetical protein
MRRLDGDAWGDAQLVSAPEVEGDWPRVVAWSPTTEQLLFEDRRRGDTRRIGVATPREDGSVGVNILFQSEGNEKVEAQWSPGGDRVVVAVGRGAERHVILHDVGRGAEGEAAWPSRELAPPTGTTLDALEPGYNSGRQRSISPDGRWITVKVTTLDDKSIPSSEDLYSFSTSGEGAPRPLSACHRSGQDSSADWCVPWSWHPETATLLVQRIGRDRSGTLEAWTPETGSHVVVGRMFAQSWLTPKSTRLLTKADEKATRLSIVDVNDVTAPEIFDVPTTELPSFQYASISPDGRWLLAHHTDFSSKASWLEAIDLRGAPPWPHRDLHRSGYNATNRETWSPNVTFVLIEEEDESDHVRATRIDLETGAKSSIEVTFGPVPSNFRWSWEGRVSPDERTMAINHDGTLSLWPMGAPLSDAAPLTNTPDWAIPFWRPSNDHP